MEYPIETKTEISLAPGAPPSPPATPLETKVPETETKKYKLKIGESDEELPEEELIKLVQAARSSTESLNEYEKAFKLLKENPRQALSDPNLGIDLYKLAEETLLEKIQQDMLTPEQKKLTEYEKKVKEFEEREKAEKTKKEQEVLREAEAHWVKEYDRLFHEALTCSDLPKTPRTIKRMAELASVELEAGRDVDAKTLATTIRAEYVNELKELLSASEEDSLLQLLGDEIGNKIRKADLKRLKSKTPTVTKSQTTPREAVVRIDKMSWRDQMERIKQGLE